MAKLIYIDKNLADSKTWLGSNWQQSANDYFRSLAFTNDGHIITHGKVFVGIDTTYQLTLNGTTNGSGTSLGSFYAPTSAGSNHQILQSSGSGAPSWASLVTTLASSEDYTIATSYAIRQAIANATAGLTGAMHYKGVSSTVPTESGATVSGISEYIAGDVVSNGNKEYVYTGSTAGNAKANWRELGDEGSYLLKSAKPLSSTTLSIGTGTIGEGITVNLSTITVTNTKGNNNLVNGLTVDSYGRVTAVSYATGALTDTTHNFYLGASGAKANATSATSNPYLTTKLTSAASGTDGTNIVQFKGTDYLTVSGNNGIITFTNTGLRTATASVASNVTGVYTIGTITKGDGSTLTLYGHDVNTWRNVTAYLKSNNTSTEILSKSVGTADLAFGSEFLWDGDTSDGTLHIGWAEVDSSGNITYSV